MGSSRIVTEADFRMPKYAKAKVEDYEFRDDGALVRKDRWEEGIRRIWCIVNDGSTPSREFEIDDVVERVRTMALQLSPEEIPEDEDHG